MKKITQVENVSSEDFKKEIVTDLVTEMKKEFQFLTENFKTQLPQEFIDSKEACKILGVTQPTLLDWRNKNIIIAYRIGNKIRFKRSEIENSLKQIKL